MLCCCTLTTLSPCHHAGGWNTGWCISISVLAFAAGSPAGWGLLYYSQYFIQWYFYIYGTLPLSAFTSTQYSCIKGIWCAWTLQMHQAKSRLVVVVMSRLGLCRSCHWLPDHMFIWMEITDSDGCKEQEHVKWTANTIKGADLYKKCKPNVCFSLKLESVCPKLSSMHLLWSAQVKKTMDRCRLTQHTAMELWSSQSHGKEFLIWIYIAPTTVTSVINPGNQSWLHCRVVLRKSFGCLWQEFPVSGSGGRGIASYLARSLDKKITIRMAEMVSGSNIYLAEILQCEN